MKKKIFIIILLIVLLAGAGFLVWFFKKGQANIYHITDESLGVTFSISKDFERMGQDELRLTNPSFVYGFRPKDVKDASCIVSQTQRLKPGYISPEDIKNGTFAALKKSYPTAELTDWQEIKVGGGLKGARLEVNYKVDKSNFRISEVVGTTDERTTFAFCSAPASLYKFYQSDFNTFLSSLYLK